MKALIDEALKRSRTVLATLVFLLVAGTIAYVNIPKESSPDVNIPILYVSMSLEGVSPEDAERLLIRPVEQEMRSLEGLKGMTATGYQGGGNIVLEFEAGFDVDKALDDARQRLDDARPDLPDEADEPSVEEVNFSLWPILVVTLSGDLPERTLVKIAEDLQDKIEGIDSVLEAKLAGKREELLEILIDPLKIESYNLNGPDLIGFFNRSNKLVAAGNLQNESGSYAVKVPGLFEEITDIWNMPMKADGDSVVMFRDIASIRRTFKDPSSLARVNGKPAIALEVSKRVGENIIDTIEHIKQTVEAESQYWPENIEITYSRDQSKQIRTMLLDLQNNVISAVLLVMIICVAALGMRTALLVGVAIPGSFLTGILVLSTMGLTVNIVVLFSLILAVGMLVDGAIVVTEYADRKMVEGWPRNKAYAMAAKRMFWPIFASTLTTLSAFAPLLFWPGVVGEFMKYLPITLLAILSASLVMAMIFVPTLGAYFGKKGSGSHVVMETVAKGDKDDLLGMQGFTGQYLRLLDKALRHPGKVLLGAVAMLFAIQFIYAAFGKGVEFFPDVEPENAFVLVHARGNLSIYEQDNIMREVENKILDLPYFTSVYTRTGSAGGGDGGGGSGEAAPDVIGQIILEFADWQTRPKADDIFAEIRTLTSDLSGIQIEMRKEEGGPPTGKPVQLQLSARNPALLDDAVVHAYRALDEVGGFIELEDDLPLPGIEWEIKIDRAQALKFGADLLQVGEAVRLLTNGLKLGTYRPDDTDEEIDIVARYPADLRRFDQLEHVRIDTPFGMVPISNFVSIEPKPAEGLLHRTDMRRTYTVKADVPPGVLANDKVTALRAWFSENPMPEGVTMEYKGEDEEEKESAEFLQKAFMVALCIMGLILVTQFNSFSSGLLILSAVIMSTMGVMLGLMAIGQPFGIVMSGIGVIALAGIVVNNNIVLIDTFDRLVEDAHELHLAILKTGAQRLRPVLLTAVTTILGLIPMTLQLNIDFFTREVTQGAPSTQWWSQLSTAIVFGLGFATILTLIVTPCALMWRGRIIEKISKKWQNKTHAPEHAGTVAE